MSNITCFRYPGAKNRLLPVIGEYLYPLIEKYEGFSDAFIGGGSVLLDIATKYPDKKLYANDKDYLVSSFWSIVSSTDKSKSDQLKQKLQTKPTVELFYELRKSKIENEVDAAYRAIFFNRTSFSGDMRSKASPIGGKNQLSKYKIDCRYNTEKLVEKVDFLSKLLVGRLEIKNCDILNYDILDIENVAVYLDPPYFVAGKLLYEEQMSLEDHKRLSEKLKDKNNWIASYDNCKEINEIYGWAEVKLIDVEYCIKGTKISWNKTKEIIIVPPVI